MTVGSSVNQFPMTKLSVAGLTVTRGRLTSFIAAPPSLTDHLYLRVFFLNFIDVSIICFKRCNLISLFGYRASGTPLVDPRAQKRELLFPPFLFLFIFVPFVFLYNGVLVVLFINDSAICSNDDSEEIIQAKCHYTKAQVDGLIFNIGDDAHVKVMLFFLQFTFIS